MQVLTRPIGCIVWFKYSHITPVKFSHECSDAVVECSLFDSESHQASSLLNPHCSIEKGYKLQSTWRNLWKTNLIYINKGSYTANRHKSFNQKKIFPIETGFKSLWPQIFLCTVWLCIYCSFADCFYLKKLADNANAKIKTGWKWNSTTIHKINIKLAFSFMVRVQLEFALAVHILLTLPWRSHSI